MNEVDILLIGFEEGENLGLRFITAFLLEKGIKAEIQPYHPTYREKILERIRESNPRIVGFSLIFQRMLYDFADLISYLRSRGVTAHFTMGGHFPTVESRRTLEEVTGLDSVVRGEGEETLLELFQAVDTPGRWPSIKGLAFRQDGRIEVTPPRPLIEDLDNLPFAERNPHAMTHRGLGVGTLLGSRGCYYDCSFCSIRRFYSEFPGPVRRSRSPQNVVREMAGLFHEKGVRIFIFEDDDFLTRNKRQRQWVKDFVGEVKAVGIGDRILWRVSCRIDDLEADLIEMMREVGLMCVYLGIESGNARGLEIYNKHYRVEDIHKALDILRVLDVPYEFGFMIFNPGSTFESIKEDIAFLKEINLHKQGVFQFTKMVPYAGTPIAQKLEKEGKLLGDIAGPDYSYNDSRLDLLQLFFTGAFHYRNFDRQGLVERLRHAKFDALVADKFFSQRFDTNSYFQGVRELIYRCNVECLEKMSLGVNFMSKMSEQEILVNWNFLQRLVQEEKIAEQEITHQMQMLMHHYGAA